MQSIPVPDDSGDHVRNVTELHRVSSTVEKQSFQCGIPHAVAEAYPQFKYQFKSHSHPFTVKGPLLLKSFLGN